ncbi:Gfo/Idh/MocA family oxidoreductase [Neobacillus niacini]|uniref:Gfo/Idh/MocA family protein n=1 Tax=Neobacillus niacini TaxID=86668 RepID=UPI002FFDF826
MTNRILRIGVIGGSINNGWAKETHIPAISLLPELELLAVGTSRIESAEKSAREFKATHAFTNTRELAQHPDVDMVVVSVKVMNHFEEVKKVIHAGKHVYCEWPLASNTDEAIELLQLADSAQIHTAIGLQARQAPAINYVKDLIEEGFVGRVLSANMRVNTNLMGSWTSSRSKYTVDNSLRGNLLAIFGGHSLDAFTYMLGDFKELSATVQNQIKHSRVIETGETIDKTSVDQILVNGTLLNGATACIHFQGGVTHQLGVVLEIFGDKGGLVLSVDGSSIQRGPYKLLGARVNAENESCNLQELVVPKKYQWIPTTISKNDSAFNVAQAHSKFAKDILEDTNEIPSFADAVKLHQLLDTIEKVAESGQRQFLPIYF